MPHYLAVAHAIDTGELAGCLGRIARDDARSAFTLLYASGQDAVRETTLRLRSGSVRRQLEDTGVYLARTLVGDASPLVAVEDELRARPEVYDAVLLCTPRPRGLRAWLRGDVRTTLEARVQLPVFHLHADSGDPWRRTRRPRSAFLTRLWERTRFAPSAAEVRGELAPSRRQLLPVYGLVGVYLLGGLGLAITVNRGFLLNDAVAIVVYSGVIGGLVAALRAER